MADALRTIYSPFPLFFLPSPPSVRRSIPLVQPSIVFYPADYLLLSFPLGEICGTNCSMIRARKINHENKRNEQKMKKYWFSRSSWYAFPWLLPFFRPPTQSTRVRFSQFPWFSFSFSEGTFSLHLFVCFLFLFPSAFSPYAPLNFERAVSPVPVFNPCHYVPAIFDSNETTPVCPLFYFARLVHAIPPSLSVFSFCFFPAVEITPPVIAACLVWKHYIKGALPPYVLLGTPVLRDEKDD